MILDIVGICDKLREEPELVTFIHNIILLIKLAVPIILVIFGILDLAKGVIASKEDEIKKGQNTFIKRLIAGVIVFFIVSITQLVVSVVDKESAGEFWECADAIMNGKVIDKIKAPEDGYDDNLYRETEAHPRCCESLGGKYHNGVCEDKNGYIISSDKVDKCVLSGG